MTIPPRKPDMFERLEKRAKRGKLTRARSAHPKDISMLKAAVAAKRAIKKKRIEKQRQEAKTAKLKAQEEAKAARKAAHLEKIQVDRAAKQVKETKEKEEKAQKALIKAENERNLAALKTDLLDVWSEEERNAWKYLPQIEKRKVAAELLMRGLDCKTASRVVWGNEGALYGWLSKHTKEFHQLMKTELTTDALLEVPATWGKLKTLRESPNWETSRKAVLDCLRAAGVGVDTPASNPMTVNIQAENVNMQNNQNLTVQELDGRILELAKEIGDPEAIQLVESELKGPKNGKAIEGGKAPAGSGGEGTKTRETQSAPVAPPNPPAAPSGSSA